MTSTLDHRRTLAFYVLSKLIATHLILSAMTFLWWRFGGPQPGDWIGYSEVWDYDGAWLARQGRDPLFVQSFVLFKQLFGQNGYESFRLALYSTFALLAVRLAWLMPSARLTPFVPVAIVLAALMMKTLVQIREGMAFSIIALGLITLCTRPRRAWLTTGVTAGVASQIHSAEFFIVAVWILATALQFLPAAVVASRATRALLTLAGLVTGAGAALLAITFSPTLEAMLQDLGLDTTVQVASGALKLAYWVVMGIVAVVIRRQLLGSAPVATKFAFTYTAILACWMLPAIYLYCAILVFTQYYLPGATSFGERLLVSTMGMGLLIIGIRGKANLLTFGAALWLIVDAFRYLIMIAP